MTSLFTLRALLFAGEFLAVSALVLGAVWLAMRSKSAGVRHFAWFTGFGVLLVLPLLAVIVPPQVLIELASAAPPPALPEPVAIAASAASAAPSAPPVFTLEHVAMGLFALWLAGALWITLRGAVGLYGLRALYRRSVPYFLEHPDPAKFVIAGRRWKLRLSTMPGPNGPMAWGVFRPVILLPKAAVLWPRERLEAVLLHELAHVRRHDCLAQLVSLAVCALYWPNPLVWLGAHAMRREAEIAADNEVLTAGVKPSTYAEQLVELADKFRGGGAAFAGLAMAEPSALETRIESVLARTRSRSGVTKMDALKIAGLGLLSASLLVLARPSLALADEPPPPSIDNTVQPVPPSDIDAVADVAPLPPLAQTVTALPPAPPAPLAPPAPAAAPAPVPSVLSAPLVLPAPSTGEAEIHIVESDKPGTVSVMRVTGPEAKELMVKLRPQIEKAMAEAKKAHAEARVILEHRAEIDAKVAEALRNAKPEIERAQAKARVVLEHRAEIEAKVAETIRNARPEIERAHADARKALDEAQEALNQAQIEVKIIRRDKEAKKPAPAQK